MPFSKTVFLTLAVKVVGAAAGIVGGLVVFAGGCLAIISVLKGDSAATATAGCEVDDRIGVARSAIEQMLQNNTPNRYRRHVTQKFLSLNISPLIIYLALA
jgi:hypothetical protein